MAMSDPNLVTCSCSSNASSKSKLFAIFSPFQIREQKQLRSRFHLEAGLRCMTPSLSAFTPSLHSRASSLSSRISQNLGWSQRTYCFLLSCLLLARLEITGCEPERGSEFSSKLQTHSQWNVSQVPGHHHHHHHDPAETVISRKEEQFLHSPHPGYNGSQTSNLISEENPASVIASSFRTFDQQQHDPSDSKEDSSTGGGAHASQNPRGKSSHSSNCDTIVLKRCVDGLPPMNASGIPSSAQAVNTACRIYDAGILCFDRWAKQCLPEKHRQTVKESITGAHEMYTFLCKDPKFRSDYLKHHVCYKKLSPHWDECSRQFIEGLKRNTKHNYTAFCCIRLEFLTCVNKYSSYSCNREASKFLMKMAETLVRSTIRTKSDSTDYCANILSEQCVPIVESGGPAAGKPQMGMIILAYSVLLLFLSITVPFQLSTWEVK